MTTSSFSKVVMYERTEKRSPLVPFIEGLFFSGVPLVLDLEELVDVREPEEVVEYADIAFTANKLTEQRQQRAQVGKKFQTLFRKTRKPKGFRLYIVDVLKTVRQGARTFNWLIRRQNDVMVVTSFAGIY